MTLRFVTGFPGFLGSALVECLLQRAPDDVVVALVQPHFRSVAEARVRTLEAGHPGRKGRLRLVEGDITRPDLGLGAERAHLAAAVSEVYHLAAAYDLGISRATGEKINVGGTQHVLGFCADAPRLRRLHYVSTCYVSGRHEGTFSEDDLDVGQSFNNQYEATKFRAEAAVQAAMRAGLAGTVYRPAIVVGDSRTGATQKLDGPYSVLKWMLRWPHYVPLPAPGDPTRYTVNLVPRDFVVDAIAYLSDRPDTAGQVFHLCDPDALTVEAVTALLAAAAERTVVRVPIPAPLLKAALRRIPGLAAWTGLRPESIDYFVHPTRYTATRAQQALAETDIAVPPLASYVDRLVAYVRAHPHLAQAGMT